jgi:hypothetical protein
VLTTADGKANACPLKQIHGNRLENKKLIRPERVERNLCYVFSEMEWRK